MDGARPEVLREAARGCPSGLLGKLACASRDLRDACLAEARIRAGEEGARLPPVCLQLLSTPGEVDWALSCGCPADEDLAAALAAQGSVAALERAADMGAPLTDRVCQFAAGYGQLDALKLARARGAQLDGNICAVAALEGHINVLEWAVAEGVPWDWRTCALAASEGHQHVLAWARDNGAPWNASVCANAAWNGHLDVLRWAVERGCPWCSCDDSDSDAGDDACDCRESLARKAEELGHPGVADWVRRELA